MEQYGIGFRNIGEFGIILESYRILEYFISNGIKLTPISSYHLDYDWYMYHDIEKDIKVVVAVSQGAPMAVDLGERYIYSGIKTIVRIGTTGSLVEGLKLGNIAAPYASIKDEGTSGFYINNKAPAIADIYLTQQISLQLRKRNLVVYNGISWSTDGRWKETDEMVKEYVASGAIFADMESSALFSLGLNRKASIASISVLSDEIHSSEGSEQKGLSDKDVWFNLVLPKFVEIFHGLIITFSEMQSNKS